MLFSVKMIFLMIGLGIVFMLTNRLMLKILLLIISIMLGSLQMSLVMKFTWMSVIYCIVMISGLMIMFMYMSSVEGSHVTVFFLNWQFSMFFFMLIIFLFFKLGSFNFKLLKSSVQMDLMKLYLVSDFSILIILGLLYMLIVLLYSIELLGKFKLAIRVEQ